MLAGAASLAALLRLAPCRHHVAAAAEKTAKPACQMTDEGLEDRVRELDVALGRPLIDLEPVA